MSDTSARPVDRRDPAYYQGRSSVPGFLMRVVWFVFGAIEAIIAIRFVLELLSANAQAGFVQLVYKVSDVFMAPFNAIFATQHVAGARVEWSALVAILVYALASWALIALIRALIPRHA